MKLPVLDHGYVEFIEAWGKGNALVPIKEGDGWDNEVGIIEAARQSTQGSFRGWEDYGCDCGYSPGSGVHTAECNIQKGDKHLLRTLFNHQWNQSTPFEAAGMTIEVQAPIMVFREWHRHRTQSYNEASARYKALPDLYYLPGRVTTVDRTWKAALEANKQANSDNPVRDLPSAKLSTDLWLEKLEEHYKTSEAFYQWSLDSGIPKELARLSMPVGHYSRMRATANLRNWLAFITLRSDPKAQWEIRQFSFAVEKLLQSHFPRTHQLFVDRTRGTG